MGIIVVFKYIIGVILSYITFIVLKSLGALEPFSQDIAPFLSASQICMVFGVLLLMFFIWSRKQDVISGVHIAIKQYENPIKACIFLLGVFVWQKCIEQMLLVYIYFGELLFFYYIIEFESTRIFDYPLEEKTQVISNYTEQPIVGRNILTKSQKKALDQLIKLLDCRTSEESFNAALIGAWGKGKTSITNTLIFELQKRKREGNRYFILKISTQNLHDTQNIVEYVKKHFYCLFRHYGISGIEGKASVVYFSALAEMLKESGAQAGVFQMFGKNNEMCFSDIENERFLFAARVKKLLDKSGRKNIIFVVDDADRSDSKEQVLKLLAEFSSINGLISIVSLSEGNDILINPKMTSTEGDQDSVAVEKNMKCNAIDKYIHVRIRIEDSYHVEYEESIKQQIVLKNKKIKKDERRYVDCSLNTNGVSIFAPVQEYQTNVKISPNHITTGKRNILTELFLYNLEKSQDGFGKYFESLIMEYLYRSKELFPYMKTMLTTKYEEWDIETRQLHAMWTNIFPDEQYDWIMRLSNNSKQYFFMICQLIEAIDVVSKVNQQIQNEIKQISDVYDYYMRLKSPISDCTWENREKTPIHYSGLHEMELMVFHSEELKNLNNLLLNHSYADIKELLEGKLEDVGNFYVATALLMEFITYMRQNMNNYRTFKMQLREAELMELNYFDYLIKEWKNSSRVMKQFEELKKQNQILKEIQLNRVSLNAFINTILYTTYVTKYGTRFTGDSIIFGKLWIFYREEGNLMIISRMEGDNIVNIIMDTEGNMIEISENEKATISEKAKEILI